MTTKAQKKHSVLCIEDDALLREILVEKLKSSGYKTLEASTGEQGIEVMQEKKPDIILLDLILPGIDGFEVLTKIQNNKDVQHIPVLILSNFGQAKDIKRGRELGAQDYLIKANLNPSEVVRKVGTFLSNA